MTLPIISLFDLDGVCVKPGGYRASVWATTAYFLNRLGLPELLPNEETYPLFESIGITSEWDMVPIFLATALDAASAQIPEPFKLVDLEQAAELIQTHRQSMKAISIDYMQKIRTLSTHIIGGGVAPVERLLRLCRNGGGKELFPYICEQPVITQLFSNTRSAKLSPITRVFQNYVLGDQAYHQTYNLPVAVKTESYLARYDQPLVNADTLTRLNKLRQDHVIYPAVYTARPSLPPPGVKKIISDYSPEAEMAFNLVGFNKIPLIGYGRLIYLAEKLGEDAESFVKPSPVQALSALAAAWAGQEMEALFWAAEIQKKFSSGSMVKEVPETPAGHFPSLPDEFEIHVFEDSPIGIQAGQHAVKLLNKMGKHTKLRAYGIATDKNKVFALEACGALVFDDINEAFKVVYKDM